MQALLPWLVLYTTTDKWQWLLARLWGLFGCASFWERLPVQIWESNLCSRSFPPGAAWIMFVWHFQPSILPPSAECNGGTHFLQHKLLSDWHPLLSGFFLLLSPVYFCVCSCVLTAAKSLLAGKGPWHMSQWWGLKTAAALQGLDWHLRMRRHSERGANVP